MFENRAKIDLKDKEINVKIWKHIIDVQMHFNEIKAKNQTIFASILTAILAASGYLLMGKGITDNYFLIFGFKFHLYSIAILTAIILSVGFYILDYSIYQTLLKGAVECGKKFEIDHFSEHLTSNMIEEISQKNYLINIGKCKLIEGTSQKHKCFYGLIILALLFIFFVSLLAPIKSDQEQTIPNKSIKIQYDNFIKQK